jgi:hypothetical protein
MNMQGKWVVEIGWWMHRIEVTGDICLTRPMPTQGCRADDDEEQRLNLHPTSKDI